MNAKIFSLLVVVLVECVFASTVPEENMTGLREQMDATRVRILERKLRDDIQRELRDIAELELQLNRNLDSVHEKKRQLEIKRSQPVQCLVNPDSCFLKK